MRRLNKKGNLRSDFGMSMRNIVKSKRAAEMTIGTLVVIVLAIIVLVVIALGFGMGWSNLWSKITIYFGGGANVDSVKQACNYACTTSATYDFCILPRDVKLADKTTTLTGKTCDWLAQNKKDLGFVDCTNSEVKCGAAVPTCKDATTAYTKCEQIVSKPEDCTARGCTWNAGATGTAKCSGSTMDPCTTITDPAKCVPGTGCQWA